MAEGDDCEYELQEQVLMEDQITKSHYIPATERAHCQNKQCGVVFGYQHLRRPHHCHRCGEIFCRPCLRYRRRLNVMAQPDPLGVPRKVCMDCFEERVESVGCTIRSHTELFESMRLQARKELRHIECDLVLQSQHGTTEPRFWKEQFKVDILKECLRLLAGFKSSIGTLEGMMTLGDLRKYVKFPEWQKSTFWSLERDMVTCRLCGGKLGHRKKIRNCRVCGISLCKLCSYKELLLYVENGKRTGKNADAKLSIIKVIGSPEKEPDVSVLLYCCYDCKTDITQRQINDEEWYSQKPKPPDLESEMLRLDSKFRNLTEIINNDMEKLSTSLDGHDPEAKDPILTEENNNVKESTDVLGKLEVSSQEKMHSLKDDISRELESFLSLYDELKVVFSSCAKPRGTRLQVAYNYFKAKKDFYIETKSHLANMAKDFVQ